MVAQAGDE